MYTVSAFGVIAMNLSGGKNSRKKLGEARRAVNAQRKVVMHILKDELCAMEWV